MGDRFRTTRDLTTDECPHLTDRLPKGSIVYEFTGYTYGCISPNGIAVSTFNDAHPFYEVPADAVEPAPNAEQALERLVKYCGRDWSGDMCPICFGWDKGSGCNKVEGTWHVDDCPWLDVLAVV